ncbi:ca2+ regulator and membrane fusion protein fig1 domain-containing protein [Sarocladium implicatum]|nr:ca2+ regulator and membrane fusion protein fig1 domain-containing protein [Sarocladium implicatum]
MMAIAAVQILLTCRSSCFPVTSHQAYLTFLFSALLLGGCTLDGLRDLHIASFRETSQPMASDLMLNQSLPQLVFDQVSRVAEANVSVKEVRMGYFALCITSDRGEHICGIKDRGSQITHLADPLGLVAAAYHFRNQAITPAIIALVLSAIYIFCLSRYPDWHEEEDSNGSVREIKPFPSQWITWFSIATASVSSILLYIAIMWQQIGVAAAAVAMKGFRYGLVETGTGAAAAALGWVSVGLICLAALGIVVMMLSIRLLQSLV